ncbi:hypothetical protein QJQ45_004157 [Haematococcus lacustris]|nr:hypothetical protein QJQ45_004157 [Haematococcus lacustris]
MGQWRVPAIATRLRRSRGFDSAWYSDVHYAHLLQQDWQLQRNSWSLITRASQSKPRVQLTLTQQLQALQALRIARATGRKVDVQEVIAASVAASTSSQAVGLAGTEYPNLRVGRIFTQHLPYKSIVSAFAHAVPTEGPQAKYGLFPNTNNVQPRFNKRDSGGKDRASSSG